MTSCIWFVSPGDRRPGGGCGMLESAWATEIEFLSFGLPLPADDFEDVSWSVWQPDPSSESGGIIYASFLVIVTLLSLALLFDLTSWLA